MADEVKWVSSIRFFHPFFMGKFVHFLVAKDSCVWSYFVDNDIVVEIVYCVYIVVPFLIFHWSNRTGRVPKYA